MRLHTGQKIARTLHRQPLMIEAQTVGAAELLARARTSGATVIALRHDDAMPGVSGRNSGIDGEDAAMTCTELA